MNNTSMKPKISHKKMIEITRSAYLLGLFGGVITLAVSLSLLMKLFNIEVLQLSLFFQVSVFVHLLISILMLISVYLLRKEHHCFGGSVMLLCVSIIGLTIASGILIGPILGIIAGIMGLSEHEKLIKHHLE